MRNAAPTNRRCPARVSPPELVGMFPDEDAAERCIECARWPDGRFCPKCGGSSRTAFRTGNPQPYRCRTGFTEFNSGLKLRGVLKADETYIGGLEKQGLGKELRTGRGAVGKHIVVSIRSRQTGQAHADVVNDTRTVTLLRFVADTPRQARRSTRTGHRRTTNCPNTGTIEPDLTGVRGVERRTPVYSGGRAMPSPAMVRNNGRCRCARWWSPGYPLAARGIR